MSLLRQHARVSLIHRLPGTAIAFIMGTLTTASGCMQTGSTGDARTHSSPYLFVWAGDVDERAGDQNFLAVIDADPASPQYGSVVATAPIGEVGGLPHHTETQMPPHGLPLFANAFNAGRSWLFDLNDPLTPRAVGEVDSVPGYKLPHSFLRLPDGSVLATMQFGGEGEAGRPGGLAHFSPDGRLLGVTSSADPAFPGAPIRTYALDAAPAIDRVLTTSSPMGEERTADVLQLWRLSDLTLLRTIPVPEAPTDSAWRYPFEVRFLADGRSAMMNTFYCGFYLLSDLDGDSPAIERVLLPEDLEYDSCGVPTLIGDYWIMPVTDAREVLVLDISNPAEPKVVDRLVGDSTFVPHWASRDPGSDRIVLPNHNKIAPGVRIARFDSTTGTLTWDESFRDPATGELGVSFMRAVWPHGESGAALPHGALFGGVGVHR